jgi:hypothetical protein
MASVRRRWLDSVPEDFSDTAVVMDFYGRSYRDLKEYLRYLLDTPTEGLLADELQAEMTRRAVSPDLADRTAKILSLCETARYAPRSPQLDGAAARELADQMRQVFQAT